MSAAAAVLAGAWQAAEGGWRDVALWTGIALIVLACLLWARAAWGLRRHRVTHLVLMPPPEEAGDDPVVMIRRAREEDRAEAEADFEREIDEMVRKFHDG